MNPSIDSSGAAKGSAGQNGAVVMIAALRSLDDAEFALSGGRHGLACSAAYYAAFHASVARIDAAGFKASSHRGVNALIGKLYGEAHREVQGTLSRLQRRREDRDYLRAAEPDHGAAIAAIEAARSLVIRLFEDINSSE